LLTELSRTLLTNINQMCQWYNKHSKRKCIFDFSLTEEDMSALRGLNRGWKSCIIDSLKSHPYYPFE
ncbi:unnamed protein product, partial [Oncorhynchus mykiss]